MKPISGQRYFVMAEDGSKVSYDVFEPDISAEERASREKENETASPLTFFVVPGELRGGLLLEQLLPVADKWYVCMPASL